MQDPIALLKDYVRFGSVSTDPRARAAMTGARDFAAGLLRGLDFEVEEVSTPLHPILLATRHRTPGAPHVVIYGHYDVQPSEPDEGWTSPPFEPEIRGERLYGRGAADNKGPQVVHLCALAAALRRDPDLPLNITYLIEGEEEIGSPSFPGFLEKYADRLRADFLLLSDTGSPGPEQIVVTTALRGLIGFEVEMRGPAFDLHSGIHGGAVRNPIQALATLLGSLHDPDGRVNVPGFYDRVRPAEAWEKAELERIGLSDEAYLEFVGAPALFPPAGYSAVEAVRFAPTLEFNGIGGGFQGEGTKTVIPSRVFAKITCRLVADQSPAEVSAAVESALRERCPSGVELTVTPRGNGEPYMVVPPGRPNTPADQGPVLARAFEIVDRSIAAHFGRPPAYLREGGSVPIIADLKRLAGLDSVMVGLFTPADNLHAPDESFHLDILRNGIATFEQFFLELAGSDGEPGLPPTRAPGR